MKSTTAAQACFALSFLVIGSASAATIVYDFDVSGDDGASLDGWTDVLGESFPGGIVFTSGGSNDGGRGTGGGGNGASNQDSAHPNHIMRSPAFFLTSTSSIDFQLAGGNRGGVPTNESQITVGTSNDSGFQGLALRRVSDGAYLLFDTRSGDGNGYEAQTDFNNTALGPIASANPGEAFTLDWVDTYSGGWGFAMIDDVVLNDVNPIPEPSSMLLMGLGALGLVGTRRRRD